jgi:pimeloyl-ACP methyl ester carboxylesterase
VREGNHYYAEVKARFLAALRAIPPGSTLHLQGHSMGGGMCFLLRSDPEVRRALAAAGIVVGTLITFGAVRPKGQAGRDKYNEPGPFASLAERHYVNLDDSLALNVGAGHADYPDVITLANHRIDEPSQAHNGYGQPENYVDLPPDLLELPYLIDPASYEVYNPAIALKWVEVPELAPVPGPTPLPTQPTPEPAPPPTPTPTLPRPERSPYVAP